MVCEKKEKMRKVYNKAIELLLPYFVFSMIFWTMKMLAGPTNTIESVNIKDLLLCPIAPMGYLWYIYILFLLFVVAVLTRRMNNKIMLLIFALLYIVSQFIDIELKPFDRLFTKGIFFFIGIQICQMNGRIFTKKNIYTSGIMFFLCEFVIFLNIEVPFADLFCGILSAVFFMSFFERIYEGKDSIKKEHSLLAMLGQKSMYIYLLHQPVISVFRVILLKLNIKNIWVWIGVIVFGSVVIMCIICKLSNRIKWIDFFFMPNKYWKVKSKIE